MPSASSLRDLQTRTILSALQPEQLERLLSHATEAQIAAEGVIFLQDKERPQICRIRVRPPGEMRKLGAALRFLISAPRAVQSPPQPSPQVGRECSHFPHVVGEVGRGTAQPPVGDEARGSKRPCGSMDAAESEPLASCEVDKEIWAALRFLESAPRPAAARQAPRGG